VSQDMKLASLRWGSMGFDGVRWGSMGSEGVRKTRAHVLLSVCSTHHITHALSPHIFNLASRGEWETAIDADADWGEHCLIPLCFDDHFSLVVLDKPAQFMKGGCRAFSINSINRGSHTIKKISAVLDR
jgi:hypothetical protein